MKKLGLYKYICLLINLKFLLADKIFILKKVLFFFEKFLMS